VAFLGLAEPGVRIEFKGEDQCQSSRLPMDSCISISHDILSIDLESIAALRWSCIYSLVLLSVNC